VPLLYVIGINFIHYSGIIVCQHFFLITYIHTCWSIWKDSKLSVMKQDWSQNECISKGTSGLYTQTEMKGDRWWRWSQMSHTRASFYVANH
jgi:hypothetical protein